MKQKRSWGKQNKPQHKRLSASGEYDTAYLLGLEENCVLGAPLAKTDFEFKQVMLPSGPMKDSNSRKASGIGQSEVVSSSIRIKSDFFADPLEIVTA